MTDENSIPEPDEGEMHDLHKSERQLGAEAYKLLQRQESLFKKHTRVVADIHAAIIEFGNKLQTGRELYQFDNNGYSFWIHRSKLNTGHIYGGKNGQQELTAARTIAILSTAGYAEDPETAVPEKLDLTGCQRVRPTDIVKWARKRQPQLFPKMAKPPGKKKLPALPDEEIPALGGGLMPLEQFVQQAINRLGDAEAMDDRRKMLLLTRIEQLYHWARQHLVADSAPPDEDDHDDDDEEADSTLSWSGSDATGWVGRSTDTDRAYEVRHTKARGSKWNVFRYDGGADGERINLNPISDIEEAKAVGERDFAESGAS